MKVLSFYYAASIRESCRISKSLFQGKIAQKVPRYTNYFFVLIESPFYGLHADRHIDLHYQYLTKHLWWLDKLRVIHRCLQHIRARQIDIMRQMFFQLDAKIATPF